MQQPTPTTQPAGVAAKVQLPAQAPKPSGPYRVGPGDVLEVTLAGLEEVGLTGALSLRVSEQGTVTMDPVGSIHVADLTLDQVESAIHDAYVPKYIKETQVSANIISYRMIDVIVLGAVQQPTPIELRGDKSSLLHAILAAGGPTEVADGRITLLKVRTPDEPVVYDLNARSDLVRAAQPGTVEHSDVIIVERGTNDYIYVQGLVNTPGPVPMPPRTQMSVLQAIGAAGGTLHAFSPREATLMRRKPDGDLIRVRLDLHALARGEDPDLALAPGDMVYVPHTSGTRFEEFLARTLYFRAGVDATYNPWTYYFFRKDIEVREDQIAATSDFFSTSGRFGGFGTPAPPTQ
jgi:polysaccharide export outer membrane protein